MSPRACRQADDLVVQGVVKKTKFQNSNQAGIGSNQTGILELTAEPYNFLEFYGLYVKLYIQIPKSWNELSPCQSRKKRHLFQNSSFSNWNATLQSYFLSRSFDRNGKCKAWSTKTTSNLTEKQPANHHSQKKRKCPAPLWNVGILEFWNFIISIYLYYYYSFSFSPSFLAQSNNFKPSPNTLLPDSKIPAFFASYVKLYIYPQTPPESTTKNPSQPYKHPAEPLPPAPPNKVTPNPCLICKVMI